MTIAVGLGRKATKQTNKLPGGGGGGGGGGGAGTVLHYVT